MKLAILFWFYKEPEICKNRLEILRSHNPITPIYGLYGGELEFSSQYKTVLDEYLDDFYAFSEEKDSYWKWIQGDLMITDWYLNRGKDLEWDTIVVVQWDMLIVGAVEQLFSMLEQDQLLLSGLRPIAEVENDWQWVSPGIPARREKYLEFLEHVQKNYNYKHVPLGCLFIVVGFPKIFLDQYSKVENPELGFLEYRIPIYAQIFGIPFCNNHSFHAWWIDVDPIFQVKNPIKRAINALLLKLNPNPLNPAKREISIIPIACHLSNQYGARIFHPYEKIFPKKSKWFMSLIHELGQDIKWLSNKMVGQK